MTAEHLATIGVFGASGRSTTRTMIDAVLSPAQSESAQRESAQSESAQSESAQSAPKHSRETVVALSPDGSDRAELLAALAQLGDDSIAVLSADRGQLPTPAGTVISFGQTRAADVRADTLDVTMAGTRYLLHTDEETRPVQLRMLGEHLAVDSLAAIAVGLAHGVPVAQAVARLEALDGAGPGRMERIEGDGITIINDAAGAHPDSVSAALKTLAQLGRVRRSVAVLGELRVDGDREEVDAAHDRIGRLVVRLNIARLVVVGHDARHIHNAAGLEGSWDGESVLVDSAGEAYDLLREVLHEEDVVLVKSERQAGLAHLAHRLGEIGPGGVGPGGVGPDGADTGGVTS